MQFFEATGLWFPADDPDNAVGGTLRFSPEDLELTLLGSFREAWSFHVGEEYPVIHGVVNSNPHGHYATIFGGVRRSNSFSMPGVSREVIVAPKAVLGDEFLDHEDRPFSTAHVEFTYLLEWYGLKTLETDFDFDQNSKTPVTIRFKDLEASKFAVPGGSLSVGHTYSTDGSLRKAGIGVKAGIVLDTDRKLSINEYFAKYIRHFQDLMSFATDRPNAVERIGFSDPPGQDDGHVPGKQFSFIYNAVFSVGKTEEHLIPQDMLLMFEDCENQKINIFEKWLDFTAKHHTFCSVYFSGLYRPPFYLEGKFSRLLSAFTLLSASLSGPSERTTAYLATQAEMASSHFPPDDLDLISPLLPVAAEVEMPLRLLELLERHDGIMRLIVPGNFREFVRSIVDTLAFVQRRSTPHGRPYLQGEAMLFTGDRIHWLIKIIMLGELGFPDDKILDLVNRNRNFLFLRSRS